MPIGELAEEAQESLNKDMKHNRTFNTRKTDLVLCNADNLKGLLTASCPVIATINHLLASKKNNGKTIPIRREVRELLASPDDPDDLYDSDSD